MSPFTLFGIGFAGTFAWVLNPEAATVLFVAERQWTPPLVALIVVLGQVLAIVSLWRLGGWLRAHWPAFDRRCARARVRFGARLARGTLPVAIGTGLLGLPPASVVAALAPGLGLRARALLPVIFVMRLVRFTVVAGLATGALRLG